MIDRIVQAIFAILFLAAGCAIVYCIFGVMAENNPLATPIVLIFGVILVCVCSMAFCSARSVFYPEQ